MWLRTAKVDNYFLSLPPKERTVYNRLAGFDGRQAAPRLRWRVPAWLPLPRPKGQHLAVNMRGERIVVWFVLGVVCTCVYNPWASAQAVPRSNPSARYFAAFEPFLDGEYRTAVRVFEEEGRGAIRTPQVAWIDSICYHTMQGECYYALGRLDQALAHYTAAIQLFLTYPDFLMWVQFPTTVGPLRTGRTCPWGPSNRRSQPGQFPAELLVRIGRLDHRDVLMHGGVVQHPAMIPVRIQEVVRTLCWSIYRRTEILGPISPHDPLTSDLLAALSRSPAPPNHWSQAWIDIPHALALIAAGKAAEAIPLLNRSLVVVGQYDHPMTGLALVQLGRLALARGDMGTAATLFHDATVSAFQFEDGHLLEEAFRHAALTHILANRPGVLPSLQPAAEWAKVQDLRALRVILLAAMAEQLLIAGKGPDAMALLKEAEQTIGRREMGEGRIGAELRYLQAIAEYQRGNLAGGDSLVTSVLRYMGQGSLWLFQIRHLDTQFAAGKVTPQGPITVRTAMEIYGQLLRDPDATDWVYRPMEALAVCAIPHTQSYENWFLVALQRKEPETAVEIADYARRHRFWSTLPFGGRLLGLRWVLEGPEERLPPEAAIQKQQLLVQFPRYAALAKQAEQILRPLRQGPLAIDGGETNRGRTQQLQELAKISQQQEVILREMALRRCPALLAFPPRHSLRDIREQLPPRTVVLTFFAVGNDLYGFLFDRERYDYWKIKSTEAVRRNLLALLRAWGHYEANRELTVKELNSTAWQQEAEALLRAIVDGSRADLLGDFDELVIVPDGLAWYIPFEVLGQKREKEFVTLLSTKAVRYLPVLSLSVPSPVGRRIAARSVVVLGRLHPQEPEGTASEVFAFLSRGQAGYVAWGSQLQVPSVVIMPLVDQLVVWDDLRVDASQPLATNLLAALARGPGNTLADWLNLPWGGPDVVVLPGFHTPMESGLRQERTAPVGYDLFLTTCALMANGSRTVLISRWRNAGEICAQLVREFLQELPYEPASESWRRAATLARQWTVNPELEPRIARASGSSGLVAEHPFFWAAYMLVDAGLRPEPPEAVAEPPAVQMEKPKEPQGPAAPPLPDNALTPEKKD